MFPSLLREGESSSLVPLSSPWRENLLQHPQGSTVCPGAGLANTRLLCRVLNPRAALPRGSLNYSVCSGCQMQPIAAPGGEGCFACWGGRLKPWVGVLRCCSVGACFGEGSAEGDRGVAVLVPGRCSRAGCSWSLGPGSFEPKSLCNILRLGIHCKILLCYLLTLCLLSLAICCFPSWCCFPTLSISPRLCLPSVDTLLFCAGLTSLSTSSSILHRLYPGHGAGLTLLYPFSPSPQHLGVSLQDSSRGILLLLQLNVKCIKSLQDVADHVSAAWGGLVLQAGVLRSLRTDAACSKEAGGVSCPAWHFHSGDCPFSLWKGQ